jgi:hypothetical protein
MPKKIYTCVVSGKEIPPERVEALKMLGTPQNQWTCVEHSTVRPRQGIFLGEAGTSELLLVDKVYNDSVRSVFKSSDREVEQREENEEIEPESKKFYSDREINYYTQADEELSEDSSTPLKGINL